MAHMIKSNDFIQTLNTESVAWHGLDKRVDEIIFDGSPLDYAIVERFPVIYLNGKSTSIKPNADDEKDEQDSILKKYLIGQRPEGKEWIISCVNNSFNTFAGSELWEMMQETMSGFKHHVSTIGTLRNGKKQWITCKLLNESTGSNHYFVNFVNGLDGTTALSTYASSVRIVCENTLRFSMNDASGMERKKHTSNLREYIPNMIERVQSHITDIHKIEVRNKQLSEMTIDQNTLASLIVGVVANGRKTISTRAINVSKAVFDLSINGKGNTGKTFYDALNGFTEFHTHYSRQTKKPNLQKQLETSEFGIDADIKTRVAEIFMSDDELDKLASQGNKLIEENKLQLV